MQGKKWRVTLNGRSSKHTLVKREGNADGLDDVAVSSEAPTPRGAPTRQQRGGGWASRRRDARFHSHHTTAGGWNCFCCKSFETSAQCIRRMLYIYSFWVTKHRGWNIWGPRIRESVGRDTARKETAGWYQTNGSPGPRRASTKWSWVAQTKETDRNVPYISSFRHLALLDFAGYYFWPGVFPRF